ncbi:cell division protein FtsQ/DivIB [Hydrogenophaga sp. OTU3427]|uniref:cell division protein FtsQ/DivIB n=1 Tax=Hydrogenophaga sp. OTU3427 TaxID=3043856 RepID=UPI00313C043F
MNPVLDTPTDVRLMALASQLLLGLFVLMGLSACGMWLVRHPAWHLAGIKVQGDVAHQNVVTLRSHIAARLNGSFLTLDLAEAQRLFESVPWVRQAVVQREFPNRLKVTLTEHQAVAWWGDAGEDRLLNAQAQVFQANPDNIDNDALVELAGPDDQAPQVLALYRDLSSVFGRIDLDIRRLELNPRGNWRVVLSNQAQVELGRGEPSELMARAAQFVGTVGQVTARYQRDIESADLRYPNGYAVRMRGVSTVDAATAAKPAPRPAPRPATPKPSNHNR